jgi:hypothetical protein
MKKNKIAGKFIQYVENTFLTMQWIDAFCDIWKCWIVEYKQHK